MAFERDQQSVNVSIDARLHGLETSCKSILSLMDERDRRYQVVDLANKDAVRTALANAEKASEKTESALKEYKLASNEWRDTVKDLVSRMPTRSEIESYIKNVEEKITRLTDDYKTLRSISEERTGKGMGLSMAWSILIQIITLLGALGVGVFVGKQ